MREKNTKMWALRYLSAVILILTPFPIVNGGDCGAKFQNKCSCGLGEYIDRMQYIVNCTNTGFRDTTMLQALPKQTEVLIWTGNYVPELPWNVFGAINNLDNLTIIDMSNNHIREIRGKSYHHVSNVKRLILNHNNLSISRDDDEFNHHHPRVFSNFINLMELHLTNAFSDNSTEELSEDLHDIFVNSNLTKLTKLHLEQNEIKKFKDKRVFCDLPSIRDLHLGDNLLEEINFDILCLSHMRFLDLERNKFTQMRKADLYMLDMLGNIPKRDTDLIVDLTYNQLACDCTVNNIQEWLTKTKVKIRNLDNLFCYKQGHKYQPLLSVKYNKCHVQSRDTTIAKGHTIALVFLSVVILTILLTLVITAIYINRNRIKKIVNPVMTNVSRKVHYTTIKDDDAPEQYV
ncbi:unnamed protein product [Chironomus riparius]|uniref:Uncharacterized protein n=1 Tax=Chironomus riparius TaxID=315576 RepID=A0A9N9WTW7_9DIPT|nr:unnamed protein product [Chironomus riparius]